MAHSQEVSRPGGEQYLVVEHDGAQYEAKKEPFQERVDGELVEREEYVLEHDPEEIPFPVVAEVDRANGAGDDGDRRDDKDGDRCAYVKDDSERCELPATGDDEFCHLEAHHGGN
jgi:hypothetical protein